MIDFFDKIWDCKKRKHIIMPENMNSFYKEIDEVCKKYNLSIFHEDEHGSFVIEEYKKNNIERLKNASKNY